MDARRAAARDALPRLAYVCNTLSMCALKSCASRYVLSDVLVYVETDARSRSTVVNVGDALAEQALMEVAMCAVMTCDDDADDVRTATRSVCAELFECGRVGVGAVVGRCAHAGVLRRVSRFRHTDTCG
jgi:hypothetical protein